MARVERHFQHYFYRQPLDCLSYMQKKRIACDVTLQVQGQAIPCHRVILAAHSSVFHAMFEDNPEFKIVNIADISHEVLYSIVRFCYTNVTDENMTGSLCLDYLFAADKYDFHEIRKLCCDWLIGNINQKNMLQFLDLALEFHCDVLKDRCLEIFMQYSESMIDSEEFLDISHHALRVLMECHVTSRDAALFLACRRWARAECRRQHMLFASEADIRSALGDVLQLISLNKFGLDELKMTKQLLGACDNTALYRYFGIPKGNRSSDTHLKVGYSNLRKTACARNIPHFLPKLRCKKCHKAIDTDVGLEWVCCAECSAINFCIPCVLQDCHEEHMRSVQVFSNRGLKRCCRLCGRKMLSTAMCCSLCPHVTMCHRCFQDGIHSSHQAFIRQDFIYGSFLLLLGGVRGSGVTASCDIYDVFCNKIDEADFSSSTKHLQMPTVPQVVKYAAVAEDKNSVFLAGGCGLIFKEPYNTLLRFDKTRMRWEELATMPVGRHSSTAAILDDKLLLVGGYNGQYILASVIMYKMLAMCWTRQADYPDGPIMKAAACAWDGAYYVSGGEADWLGGQLFGFNKFDPVTATWQRLSQMRIGRSAHSTAAIGDHLYVLGGTTDPVGTIEMYDRAANQFTIVATMPRKINTNAIVLQNLIVLAGGDDDTVTVFETLTNTVTTTKMKVANKYWQTHVAVIDQNHIEQFLEH